MFENVNPKEQSTETSRENVEFSEKNDERTFKVENDDSFIFAEIEDLPPIEDFDIEDKIEPFLDIDEWPPLESIEECDILIAPVSEVEPFPLADSPKSFLAEKSDDNETKTDKPIIKITDENRKNPEPNTIYVGENGAIYETDGKGRVIKCIFKPELVDDKRSPSQNKETADVGKQGREGDHGGHIQAHSLGGTTDRVNLFPQDGNFNTGVYKQFENSVKKDFENGKEVKVEVKLVYDNQNSPRPDKVIVTKTVDGIKTVYEFKNEPNGGQNA